MLEALTAEELANFQVYVAEMNAREARDRAEGRPRFADVIDSIRNDESEFSGSLGDGYLSFYDKTGPRPEMTAPAVYAYLTSNPGECSPEWLLGFACGWFAALCENEPSFFWESSR